MMAGGYDRSRDGLADGCCSALSPCSHQQRDPTTICAQCEATRTPRRDAEPDGEVIVPLRCPIDMDASREFCSAGYCGACLLDEIRRLRAETTPSHPESPKPAPSLAAGDVGGDMRDVNKSYEAAAKLCDQHAEVWEYQANGKYPTAVDLHVAKALRLTATQIRTKISSLPSDSIRPAYEHIDPMCQTTGALAVAIWDAENTNRLGEAEQHVQLNRLNHAASVRSWLRCKGLDVLALSSPTPQGALSADLGEKCAAHTGTTNSLEWLKGAYRHASTECDRAEAERDAAEARATAAERKAEGLSAALTEAAAWHDREHRALMKQPPTAGSQWDRHQHEEQAAMLRAALAQEEIDYA